MLEFQYTCMSLAELKALSNVQSSDIPNFVHIAMRYKQNILYFTQYLVKKIHPLKVLLFFQLL